MSRILTPEQQAILDTGKRLKQERETREREERMKSVQPTNTRTPAPREETYHA